MKRSWLHGEGTGESWQDSLTRCWNGDAAAQGARAGAEQPGKLTNSGTYGRTRNPDWHESGQTSAKPDRWAVERSLT